ncbi:OLC1v1016004C2 [Oldenlandia corymbosa var. corymbosa]|nr:OLC1v1016004C2 [Oldenlandia corymbosa var. corymbosa]
MQNLQRKSFKSSYPFSTSGSETYEKLPQSLAEGIVHYATANFTPQQTFKELQITLKVLERRSPCNFLIFGLGNDSLMWSMLNHNGRTVFLEENQKWMEEVKKHMTSMEAYQVDFDTYTVGQAVEALHIGQENDCKEVTDPRLSKCKLAIKNFPDEVYNTEWDVIMVDGPTGFRPDLPGRMTAIYTAGLMARNRKNGETDVFVHDIDRWVENKFSMTFLCEAYWREEIGKIRHFTIPSHRGVWLQRPFCP